MSGLLNAQYNSVFSTPDPTKAVKYPRGFLETQAKTILAITDAMKSTSEKSSGGLNEFPALLLKQCSKSPAHPLLNKVSLNTGEIPIDLKRDIIAPYIREAPGTFPRTTVLWTLQHI